MLKLFKGCKDGVHKFEPRYDEKPRSAEMEIKGFLGSNDLREMIIVRTYIQDVCVRCGKIIEREKK